MTYFKKNWSSKSNEKDAVEEKIIRCTAWEFLNLCPQACVSSAGQSSLHWRKGPSQPPIALVSTNSSNFWLLNGVIMIAVYMIMLILILKLHNFDTLGPDDKQHWRLSTMPNIGIVLNINYLQRCVVQYLTFTIYRDV